MSESQMIEEAAATPAPTPTLERHPKSNAEKCRAYRARKKAKPAESRERDGRVDIQPLGEAGGVQYEAYRLRDSPKNTPKLVGTVQDGKVHFTPAAEAAPVEFERGPDDGKIQAAGQEPDSKRQEGASEHSEGKEETEEKIDISRPPRRLPLRTKAAWTALPAWAREDIILREREFDTAFKKYDGLGQFVFLCQQAGKQPLDVVNYYMAVEQQFLKHPIGGAIHAWNGMGIKADAVMVMLEQTLAAMQAPMQPEQVQEPVVAQEPAPAGLDATMLVKIQMFAEDTRNEFFGLVRDDMIGRLTDGRAQTLYQAYEDACMANRLVQELLAGRKPRLVQSAAAARAASAAKHTIGAPSSGSAERQPSGPRVDGDNEWQAVVRQAYFKAGGG